MAPCTTSFIDRGISLFSQLKNRVVVRFNGCGRDSPWRNIFICDARRRRRMETSKSSRSPFSEHGLSDRVLCASLAYFTSCGSDGIRLKPLGYLQHRRLRIKVARFRTSDDDWTTTRCVLRQSNPGMAPCRRCVVSHYGWRQSVDSCQPLTQKRTNAGFRESKDRICAVLGETSVHRERWIRLESSGKNYCR